MLHGLNGGLMTAASLAAQAAATWDGSNREILCRCLDRTELPAAETFERDFTDGRLQLQSGAAGALQLEAHHRRPSHLLIPQSLNLLLAQQWARLGLMTLHAAVIRVDGLGVLALGGRGSGKSVLTAAALTGGAKVVSDDWVLAGATEAGFAAERLRGFLMFRSGWATDRLAADWPLAKGAKSTKCVLRIPEDNPRFPISSPIHRIWLLRRPRAGRPPASTMEHLPPHLALAELIKAGMPILFSKHFPHERQALMAMLQGLLATSPAQVIETGIDLVEQPGRTLKQLLKPL